LTVGVGRTVIFTGDVVDEHGAIPVVVSVRTAVPVNEPGGVQMAFKVLAFGLNVPPAGVVQVPPEADPPTMPVSDVEPPWQMVWAMPALAVGNGRTVIVTFEDTEGQGDIPVVVNVNIDEPEKPAGGVQVAFRELALGEKVPPSGVDQVPPIAAPPTVPVRFAVPPWQMV
jgi:hypothetical protein